MEIKERIIRGSLELMKVGGVRRTTMDSVAQHIGVSKRTIYEQFTDKEGLIIAIIEFLMLAYSDRKARVAEQSDDIIDKLFVLLSEIEKDFMLHGQISNDIKKHYPDLYNRYFIPHYEELYKNMVIGINEGVAMGYIKEDIDIKFAVYVIMESIFNLMNNYERVGMVSKISPFEAFKYMFIHFFRGIATTKGINKIDGVMSNQEK